MYRGRYSSVGIATFYGLDGPGIEFLLIAVAELSKARVCIRSVSGITGSNPSAVIDVCVVCCTVKTKAQAWIIKTRRDQGKELKNPGGGEIFRTRPDRPWGPPSLPYNGYRVSFPGVISPGCGFNHRLSSRIEVKERVERYLYFPSGLSWHTVGRTLHCSFTAEWFQKLIKLLLRSLKLSDCCRVTFSVWAL